MTASEFKKQYVDTMDAETIFKVFRCFDDETINEFEKGLTEQDWKEMTFNENAVFQIASWSSSDFKRMFCDKMTHEKILHAFSVVDDVIL